MGGRFGKYGDFKRKAKLRQSRISKRKAEKIAPITKGLPGPKKKPGNNT
jgi:hypothetical protein